MTIQQDLEDAIIQFVRERIPSYKWKYLTNRSAIEGEMEDDDVDELKDYMWDLLINSVKWNSIVDDVQDMVEDSDDEEETESTDTE